jgi:hypothetical protein
MHLRWVNLIYGMGLFHLRSTAAFFPLCSGPGGKLVHSGWFNVWRIPQPMGGGVFRYPPIEDCVMHYLCQNFTWPFSQCVTRTWLQNYIRNMNHLQYNIFLENKYFSLTLFVWLIKQDLKISQYYFCLKCLHNVYNTELHSVRLKTLTPSPPACCPWSSSLSSTSSTRHSTPRLTSSRCY